MTYTYRGASVPDVTLQKQIEILQSEKSVLTSTIRRLNQQITALNAIPHNFRNSAPPCGTHSGYQRHMRDRTKPCNPCKYARAQYMRDYRSKKKEGHDGRQASVR